MILSDIILQASNTTSVDALLSQTSGTGITAIVIAIVGIAAAFVEFLRRSGKDKQLDFKDKDLETKGQDLEKKDQELDGKHNVLQNATTNLVQKHTDLETKATNLEDKDLELDKQHRDLEATT